MCGKFNSALQSLRAMCNVSHSYITSFSIKNISCKKRKRRWKKRTHNVNVTKILLIPFIQFCSMFNMGLWSISTIKIQFHAYLPVIGLGHDIMCALLLSCIFDCLFVYTLMDSKIVQMHFKINLDICWSVLSFIERIVGHQ